jgi:spore germination protein GerM
MNQKKRELDKNKSRKKAKLQPVSKSKYRNLKSNFIISNDDDDDDDFIEERVKRASHYDDDSFEETLEAYSTRR